MALQTPCQTPGAVYRTHVGPERIQVTVDLPVALSLDEERAALLEANLHNAIELCLAPHFQGAR